MPPKTQSFAVASQEGASPDNGVEHLDVPPWPQAREPLNWLISDPQTCLVNGVRALKGTGHVNILPHTSSLAVDSQVDLPSPLARLPALIMLFSHF